MDQKEINQAEWSDPANWSCGFYFSKKDSRTWVPKSIPWMGWTLNIGRTAGACWLLGLIIGIPLLIVPLVHVLHQHHCPLSISPSRQRAESITTAIDTYEVDTGHYPPSLEALLIKDAETKWYGPYVRSTNTFLDAWGHLFRYKVKGDNYEIRSAGPDGVFDTGDDISN